MSGADVASYSDLVLASAGRTIWYSDAVLELDIGGARSYSLSGRRKSTLSYSERDGVLVSDDLLLPLTLAAAAVRLRLRTTQIATTPSRIRHSSTPSTTPITRSMLPGSASLAVSGIVRIVALVVALAFARVVEVVRLGARVAPGLVLPGLVVVRVVVKVVVRGVAGVGWGVVSLGTLPVRGVAVGALGVVLTSMVVGSGVGSGLGARVKTTVVSLTAITVLVTSVVVGGGQPDARLVQLHVTPMHDGKQLFSTSHTAGRNVIMKGCGVVNRLPYA